MKLAIRWMAWGMLASCAADPGPPARSTGVDPLVERVPPRATYTFAFVLLLPEDQSPASERTLRNLAKLERIAEALEAQVPTSTYGAARVEVTHITTIQDDGPIRGPNPAFGEDQVDQAKRVFREHFYTDLGDDFDYVAVYADAPEDARFGGTHLEVGTVASGLGRTDPVVSRHDEWGSDGRLRSVGLVTSTQELPEVYDFQDSQIHLLLHETLGHSFGVQIPELSSGNSEHFLTGIEAPQFTVMYGRPWQQQPDLTTFTVREDIDETTGFHRLVFHPWVLYHVGLLERDEVPDQVLSIDLETGPSHRYDTSPVTGHPTALRLDDLIARHGDREVF